MRTLTWEERCDLAHCFAPHLVLFPEKQDLGRPGKASGAIGDYHPRGIGPLLARSEMAAGLYWPRQPATLDALAKSKKADDQLLILGTLMPDPDLAWRTYFDILNSTDPQGQTGRNRYPLTVYARVLTRAEADAASKNATNLGRDYPLSNDEVGRPLFRPNSTENDDDVSIQYWFCYYYDDWANQHEGDWEGIAVFLHQTATGHEPVGASYTPTKPETGDIGQMWSVQSWGAPTPWCSWRPDRTPHISSTYEMDTWPLYRRDRSQRGISAFNSR